MVRLSLTMKQQRAQWDKTNFWCKSNITVAEWEGPTQSDQDNENHSQEDKAHFGRANQILLQQNGRSDPVWPRQQESLVDKAQTYNANRN